MNLNVRKMGTFLGGTVEGVRLLDIATNAADDLKKTLWRYGVLHFKKQHLSPAEMVAVARALGEPALHEHAPRVEGYPEVVCLTSSGTRDVGSNRYHSDVTYREVPISTSILQAIEVPEFGGDTLVVSASKAYEKLPRLIKKLFLELEAEHDYRFNALRTGVYLKYADRELATKFLNTAESTVHPVIINHPFTGQLLLYVNEIWTKKIANLPLGIGNRLLELAYDVIRLPELQVRIHWEKGDVAIWDNFGVIHYGPVADLEGETLRVMYRVHTQDNIQRPTLDKAQALRQLELDTEST